MVRLQVEVCNKLGLHTRAAAKVVNTAARFRSRITVHCGGKSADAGSIMALMMLAAAQGARLTVEAAGPDAAQAAGEVAALVRARFGEED
ncbi:MAG: HPr family phosphocarrier protein [Gammaproteobacteria bacterium]|nr:HPr family phosphocarrier protein [Gammaproteobacteria bacterium]MDD9800622.1 HPr family phosphocarrier protein [Gammaproteobacteria bacterium]MDD9816132.1 HPr family phosphocarrier protein [Gammaproteobacteria bacterium]MDD9851287.1 HPr family phosphocarrier protein [Gammaproteobacteria bacterium]MDD9870622.1 HPr family phosphocarrier protein [Gammaproteobacteria bacterium]